MKTEQEINAIKIVEREMRYHAIQSLIREIEIKIESIKDHLEFLSPTED